jgi:hypothetical protein
MDVVTEEVTAQSKKRRPHNSPRSIKEQKARPGHTVRAGQERGESAEHGNEASKEDHFAAMLQKEILSQFQSALFKANVATIATEQTIAAFTPDPETDIITHDGASGRRYDYERNQKLMCPTSIDGGNKQYGFAGEGDTYAFYAHKDENRPIAVRCEKMRQIRWCNMNHRLCAFSFHAVYGYPRTMKRGALT